MEIKSIDNTLLNKLLVPRFVSYAKIDTTSDNHEAQVPSTPGQWDLARHLEQELKGLGLKDVELTDHCYVIARIPATPGKEGSPAVGFLAHMDTSFDAPGKGVEPQIIENYDGSVISLADGFVLDPQSDEGLSAQKGDMVIHSTGKTLLGADDKAGVACMVAAAEYMLQHPEFSHGPVELIFSPDEETGKGLPDFPLETIKSRACYTLDGGAIGDLEMECFNGYGVRVEFVGRAIHPGTARGILANAALMASVYASMLPRSESPEATDGYFGYYCLNRITGNHERAEAEFIIRDFDLDQAKRRVKAMDSFARAVEAQFPGGKVLVDAKLQYLNMRQKIEEQGTVWEHLKEAAVNLGISFRLSPIRGGTDGSRLTEMGIPTPNIFTGGRNAHSRSEWLSVRELRESFRMVLELIRLWGSN